MPRNPFHPGVGTLPPYLAGRDPEIRRFEAILEGYPEKRRNVRLTGLRGVGKTVLLKQFESQAKARSWVVVRRDLAPRANEEAEMALFMAEVLREAAESFSLTAKLKNLGRDAAAAIAAIEVEVAEGVKVSVGTRRPATTALESRIFAALRKVGELALAHGSGFVLMLDEAHVVADSPKKRQWPFYALVSAFVRAHDQEDPALPVMLILSGLPPLIEHLQAARSHSERFFKGEELGNLSLKVEPGRESSEAVLALTQPTEGAEVAFEPQTAKSLAEAVNGYPFFTQYFGEALWDAAVDAQQAVIDGALYSAARGPIRRALDQEFYETRYRDVKPADQMTLRVAGSLGGELFRVAGINSEIASRKANANAQSLNRLVRDNVIYRDRYGMYAYTAPLFGDFLRRAHPRQEADR